MGLQRLTHSYVSLDMGLETLSLNFCEWKLLELTVAPAPAEVISQRGRPGVHMHVHRHGCPQSWKLRVSNRKNMSFGTALDEDVEMQPTSIPPERRKNYRGRVREGSPPLPLHSSRAQKACWGSSLARKSAAVRAECVLIAINNNSNN